GLNYRGTDFVPAARSLPEAAQAHAFIESRQAFGRVFLIP
ncbi:MAG TPA: oxidoreductase, partial [Myxococcales bacterium]|nr:oxidoreductase [Myxococcales bacterium]